MAGDLVTADYMYEYNDVVFGVTTEFDVEELSGFLGFPSVRSSTADLLGAHGGAAGHHFVPARNFTITMNVHGTTDIAFGELMQKVSSAFAVRVHLADELPFVYQHPGRLRRYINCRPIDLDIPLNRNYALKYPKINVRFECSDPRHYELATKELIVPLPTAGDGIDFPLDFPLNFGPGTNFEQTAANAGDAPAHWVGEITGPVTDPKIEAINLTDSKVYTLEFSGLSLILGETLVLSSRNRSIILNGQSRRRFLLPTSTWFAIPAYPNEMMFHYSSGDAIPTTSTFKIIWSDATWGN